jgi:hypothetical protein
LFCVVVVQPGLSLQVLVLPPWVLVVVNPFLFPLVLSARAALEASPNEIEDASKRDDSLATVIMLLSPWVVQRGCMAILLALARRTIAG